MGYDDWKTRAPEDDDWDNVHHRWPVVCATIGCERLVAFGDFYCYACRTSGQPGTKSAPSTHIRDGND